VRCGSLEQWSVKNPICVLVPIDSGPICIVYMYVCMYVCVCVYIYIYIPICFVFGLEVEQ
jgi:hypothetical protein